METAATFTNERPDLAATREARLAEAKREHAEAVAEVERLRALPNPNPAQLGEAIERANDTRANVVRIEEIEPSFDVSVYERPIDFERFPMPPRLDLLTRKAKAALRDVDKLAARLVEARRAERDAAHEIGAVREDEIARAAELHRRGETVPDSDAIEKAERRASRLRDDREALERALDSARRDFVAAIAEGRDEMLAKAEAEKDDAREAAAQSARSILGDLAALDSAEASVRWIEAVSRSVQPNMSPLLIETSLRHESHDPVTAHDAAAALAEALGR